MELAPAVSHAMCGRHALVDAGRVATEAVGDERALPGAGRVQAQEVADVLAAAGLAELVHHRLDRVGAGRAIRPDVGLVGLAVARLEHRQARSAQSHRGPDALELAGSASLAPAELVLRTFVSRP